MPIEFIQEPQPTGSSGNSLFRLTMAYDGTGRRISKTSMRKVAGAADWDTTHVPHYTGIGTEIRENYAGPAKQTKVVVNMPQGLGRYGIEDAENPDMGSGVGYIPNTKFEWYLKNHLGSTMLVYGTVASTNPNEADIGEKIAAYDYRAFGEMLELTPPPTDKVTENFTGKEHDDEIALNYFGARYLDPMLGLWISVDPKRQFSSPYLYAGNGYNPVNVIDPDGNEVDELGGVIYNNLIECDFFGSDELKEDWNDMKNAEIMYHFEFKRIDGASNDKESNTILLPWDEKYILENLAVYGRHEYDHLKHKPYPKWHNMSELLGKYRNMLEKNNSFKEMQEKGIKPPHEYDPIYGRDYKVWLKIDAWKAKHENNK